MKAVRVRKLVKGDGRFRAVKGISFEVREGEIFGLIGPDGVGKISLRKKDHQCCVVIGGGSQEQ